MRYYIDIVLFVVALVVMGCGGQLSPKSESNGKSQHSGIHLSEREAYRYDKGVESLRALQSLCEEVAAAPSYELITNLRNQASKITYSYNSTGMNESTISYCEQLKRRIEECRAEALSLAESASLNSSLKETLVRVEDKLFDGKTYYPVYLNKNEKLYVDIESDGDVKFKLYNADSERLVKSFDSGRVSDSLTVSNSGIYLLEVTPTAKQYASLSLCAKGEKGVKIYRPAVMSKQVECSKDSFGAVAMEAVKLQKLFDEPRKITLRGQLKAALSGNAQALISVPVPAGTTEVLYSMRISTSESSRSEDGRFHDNLTRSYKRIELFGLPFYEKSRSNGLLNTILDDNRPICDEDAYCNMYVFRSQSEAKKFQDGTKSAAQLNYDVDYSKVGTQSCSGSIPVNGERSLYLAFENERVRYVNYIWVEAEALVSHTIYYRTVYSVN